MAVYIARRIMRMLPILLVVVTLVFLMVHLIPGDPARLVAGLEASDADVAEVRAIMGLDAPLHTQYVSFMGGLLRGDMGTSFITHRPVLEEATVRFWRTLQLAVTSLVFATGLGVILGVAAGAQPYSGISALTMMLALLGVSVPTFWLGLLLMLVFSLHLELLPSSGIGTWQHFVLPTITLGCWSLGIIARMTRASVAETIQMDYVRTARAKGLQESVVVIKHALRNAFIPVVTTIGLRFGYMLGGAVATETVFNWPGLGRYIVDAVVVRDYPSIQAAILLFSLSFLIVNLMVDLAYGLIDPRITYQ